MCFFSSFDGILFATFLLFVACQPVTEGEDLTLKPVITESQLRKHIATLASDDFQGRLSASAGEEKTLSYLKEAFRKMGLQPGNGDSCTQEVPLVSINASPESPLQLSRQGETLALDYRDDVVVLTRRVTGRVEVEAAELVFCGFGIVAPGKG